MMRTSRLLPLSLGLALLLALGWFGYLRARGPALDRMLQDAAMRGDHPKAVALLELGANPNAHRGRLGSALAWAVHTKNAAMCKLLLERGAEPASVRTFTGDPLLLLAVNLGDPEIVRVIIAKGANPRLAKGQNYGPLRMAARQGHVKVLKVLLDAGVPVDEESPSRHTALMEAVEHDRVAAVQYLLSRGTEIDHRQSLETPLIRACRLRKPKVAKVLIEAGADLNVRDRSRWTPLHWAARRQNLPTLQWLAAKGAQIDARDGSGCTPLMWAAIYGNASVARWLLAHGADPTLRDGRKLTALDFARQRHCSAVVRLLQAATGEREMARDSE